jgi:DNA-binding transcriptional ArsR family regulator
MRRDVFHAIADPIRREIIQLLSHQPLNLNAIAERFDVSRPAISRHVKILVECGVIFIHALGRERYCEANLRSLAEVSEWVEPYHVFWTGKLDVLEAYLHRTESRRRSNVTHSKSKTRKNKTRN